ncbi:hypothetical protein GALMADRAFT_881522 [Galerina marginata CBS 339.88]|uniref:Uncharacterized protein n=1 Tax=Galerina marginata (strain CBS 339.88) TaxID=685588 RepID=A0A067SIH0_GALM3|nr:hypothetical protein GALMADRAFT_881522 [Galerina marginata CBS 339.88]
MKSFVALAVFLATFTGGSMALPTANGAVARRGEGFFFPIWVPPAPPAVGGPITAIGANGGFNYGGNGANGGMIDISKLPGGGAITANGANGGQNYYGDGANGGKISVGRREEDFFFPLWVPPAPPARGAITATGANGGYNYGGNGANGGSISISRREEDSKDLFLPIWFPPAPAAANGPISASGANGGTNYYGNGANGGAISINRRAEAEEDSENFFFPLWFPPAPAAAKGPITASGANGGTNYYGNGANGGKIAISARGEE